MSRGGKRAGAGRIGHGLSLIQECAVGGEFERLLNEVAEKQAWEEYKKSGRARDIDDIRNTLLPSTKFGDDFGVLTADEQMARWEEYQDWVNALAGDPYSHSILFTVEDEINDYLEQTGDHRLIELSHKRAYGVKAKAREATIKWCKERYGVTITHSKADECLKAFRSFEKWRREQEGV